MLGSPYMSAQNIRVLVLDFLSGNHRPVSLTSAVCKTMEPIIKDNLIHHLSTESLLSLFQQIFLLKKSTLSASLSTSFYWLNSFKKSLPHSLFFSILVKH